MSDRGTILRGAIVVAIIMGILGAAIYLGTHHFISAPDRLTTIFSSAIVPRSLTLDVITHIIAIVAVAFAFYNYHAVLAFIRRSLTSSDALVMDPGARPVEWGCNRQKRSCPLRVTYVPRQPQAQKVERADLAMRQGIKSLRLVLRFLQQYRVVLA